MLGRMAILACLLAPQLSLAIPGRLSFSALAGGGYLSDKSLGEGLGSDVVLQIAPSGRLDLSISPQWKFATFADFSYGQYFSNDRSMMGTATSEIRYRHPAWDATLRIGAENGRYSLDWLSDYETTNTNSGSTSLQALHFSPAFRFSLMGWDWNASGLANFSRSTTDSENYSEQEWVFSGGFGFPIHPLWYFSFSYRLIYRTHWTHNQLDYDTLTYHQASVLLSWNMPLIQWKVHGFWQANSLFNDEETKGRITAIATYPITATLSLEGAYSLSSPICHLAFLHFRWKIWEVSW